MTFSGNASFDGGEFAARVSFQHAGFLFPSPPNDARSIRFRDWHFGGVTEFDHARFERRVEFTASIFARLASFQQLTWPKCLADAQGMFSQAVFKDLASFQGAGVRRFAAFDGVVLQGGLQLDDADEPTANATFHTERKEAEAYAEREAALRHLEGGCRVLKQAMEKSSNKAREQMFYAFELMARRHQRAIPWWERLISHAYGAVADYGRSIGRPLLWLVLLVPAFAAAYAGLLYGGRGEALAGPTPRVVLVECLSHSAQRVLPFGPWTLTPAQIAQSPVQSLLQGPTDALFSLAIRGLGSLQSLLALILAFLAGLSIRRRFQIN
ncbi:hypothetical protein GGQ83_001745 [Roseococcus suduntuyensis]|uniref:Pentapeptide repeat-containing protein n=1 Tax=Roseococcus suduntuyensis TaxID=455361 RepID=A0A840A8C1_9PROT|nr:hypothetical protein [Roseococcus suduntuyensis]